MSVSLISNKKPRMTIEDLGIEMREGFKKVNERFEKQEEFNQMVLEVFKRNNLK